MGPPRWTAGSPRREHELRGARPGACCPADRPRPHGGASAVRGAIVRRALRRAVGTRESATCLARVEIQSPYVSPVLIVAGELAFSLGWTSRPSGPPDGPEHTRNGRVQARKDRVQAACPERSRRERPGGQRRLDSRATKPGRASANRAPTGKVSSGTGRGDIS